MYIRRIVLACVLVMSLGLMVSCGGGGQQTEAPAEPEGPTYSPSEPLKIGFAYSSPVGDHGWTYAHDQGRKAIIDEYGDTVSTSIVESVGEGESEQVFRNYVNKDFDLIFGTSFGFMDPMMNVAKQNPEIKFMHCSGYKSRENMSNYFIRIYQPSYLSGILAGHKTESDVIGYVAPHPIPEVVRILNAFALGARSVNPDAKIKLVWTNTWYDPAKEKEAALSVLDAGADVVGHFQDSAAPLQAAQERGAHSFGMATNMSEFAPEAHLASVKYNWGPYYVEVVGEVLSGTWESEEYWGGMDAGLVDLINVAEDRLSQEAIEDMNAARQQIIDGELEVFSGPIRNKNGEVKVEEGETMTDDEKWNMYWLVEGVQGSLPEQGGGE